MTDPTFTLFPIMAGLSFLLVLVPLPWHLEAWNSGTCYYMMWTALACLNQFVNSVVWSSDALNRAPVWCDICEFQSLRSRVSLLNSINSYTYYACRRVWNPCFCPLHYAQALQYFACSFGSDYVCRGGFVRVSAWQQISYLGSVETKGDPNRYYNLCPPSNDPASPWCVVFQTWT